MAFRPQLLAQCPGIGGIIMTIYPISAGSVVTKHDGQNIFHTYGLLLSIRNNNYYFAPKESQSDIIQAGSNERSLCIVPQEHVFQFHQNRYGYAFGKDGLYIHE